MRGVMESKRLIYRPMTGEDYDAACSFLQDPEVMYAWEHAFSSGEVRDWISENRRRYEEDGVGYLLAVERKTGEAVGNIGLLQEMIDGEKRLGVGYLLRKRYWGMGYAAEGGKACLDYAFKYLMADRVIATIRPENQRSIHVAERLGMVPAGRVVKHYYGKEMPHIIYEIKRK